MIQKTKKILAGITGIGLLVLLLFFVNAFVGNPISNALAKKAAQKYADITYNDLNLQVERNGYNFKFSVYYVFMQSTTSQDTAFSINADSFGNILGDDYESEVANNFTTYRRLDSELRQIAERVIAGTLDYDFDNIFLHFAKDADFMELERDMKLDIYNPPLPLTVDVTLFSEDISYTKIAEVAKALEYVLQQQRIPVDAYSIRLLPLSNKPEKENQAVSWVNALSLSDFPANQMNEESLPQAMEQFETDRVAEVNSKDKK